MITNATFLKKNNPSFKDRKRRNEHTRESFDTKYFNNSILDHIVAFCNIEYDDAEIKCCENSLSKDEYFQNEQEKQIQDEFDIAQLNPREENARKNARGITYALLLIGWVQFRGLFSAHIPMMHCELVAH